MAATKIIATVSATPAYWDDACKHLMKKDRVMKRLIPQFGDACLQTRGDAFATLARSIVGQQISVKAAQTVLVKQQSPCGSIIDHPVLGIRRR